MSPAPAPLLTAVIALLLIGAVAPAFPPAPHHTVFGLVRNQWGDPIHVSSAIVFLDATNSVASVRASIAASTEPGVNYRLNLPTDAGITSDLYMPGALRRSQPFLIRVKLGRLTYLPIEMTLGSPSVGQPGQSTRLDLTLGEDTDEDGLPDAWEQAIIALLGGTLAGITPDGDADGDGISNRHEYLAGTYAFDPSDGFRVALSGVSGGDATLEFFAIRGRTYTLQASTNLRQWSPVQFRILAGQTAGALQTSFNSPDMRFLRVRVPFQSGAETNRYFRALVQ